jgi:hypothetical protein
MITTAMLWLGCFALPNRPENYAQTAVLELRKRLLRRLARIMPSAQTGLYAQTLRNETAFVLHW